MRKSHTSAGAPFEQSIALFDRDGRLLEWDPGFEAEFASNRAMIAPRMLLRDLLDTAGRQECEGASLRAHADDEVAGSVFRYESGAADPVSVRRTPTPSGGFVRTAWVASADKSMEAAYESVDERWRTDGDPSAEAHTWFRIKADGNLEYARYGEDVRVMFGLSDDMDMSFESVFPRIVLSTEESEYVRAVVFALPQQLLPAKIEMRVIGSDGRLIWIRQSLRPAREADGSTLVSATYRDVTREKLGEDQLELLRSAVASATEAIRILHTSADGKSRTLYVNPAQEQMTGIPAQETINKPLDTGDERHTAGWARLLDMADRGDGSSMEFQNVHRDGSTYWVEASVTLIDRRLDGSRRWAVIGRNIDERRRVQAELLEAKEAAEAANRTKSEFLANMSHEIRTPMNGVLGMASLLLDSPLTPQQRQYARSIEVSGESLLAVINDILDIAKLEAGQIDLESIDFDLVDTVENAVTLMSGRAGEKGVDLAIDIDPAAELMLRGDPNRIRQVILNLVGNGIKFTHGGSVSLHVSMAAAARDGSKGPVVRFEVADTGIGVSPEVQTRLFQKFSQADSSITRRFGGTGLGLAICKQLVELMTGQIGVDSEPGQGSTFWFEIPLVAASGGQIKRTPADTAKPFTGLRALAVDDLALNLEIIARQLHRLGVADVTSLTEPSEAIAEARRACADGRPYDVIFLDLMMPGMSGDALAAQIRAAPELAATRLVLVSSAGLGGRDAAAARLFDLRFEKPLRRGDLAGGLTALFRTPAEHASDGRAPRRRAPRAEAAAGPGGLRVLLAEDHRVNQQFALAVLAAGGHEADLAENGREAVEAVRRRDYDVILMDVHMPECDGIEATRQIRAMAPPQCDVPIIALTADAMTGSREEYIAGGMDGYLSKPVKAAELLSLLAELRPAALGRRRRPQLRRRTAASARAG